MPSTPNFKRGNLRASIPDTGDPPPATVGHDSIEVLRPNPERVLELQRDMEVGELKVLMVDDSRDDFILLRRALNRLQRTALLPHLRDGEEAIAYLDGQGEFGDRNLSPLPDLVLLDLRMPRVSGFDVLAYLQHRRRSFKVVVLSGSERGEDIRQALDMGADHYLLKDGDLEDQLRRVVRDLDPALACQYEGAEEHMHACWA